MIMSNLKERYNKILGRKESIESDLELKEIQLETKVDYYENLLKAKVVLSNIMESIQNRFKDQVESLITMAVRSVFDSRNFAFRLKFKQTKRGLECKPLIVETIDGEEREQSPKDDMGTSIIDLISFTFRVVLWFLEKNRTRSFFYLDEPLKHIGHGDMLERSGKVIMEIVDKLNIQLIMNTHAPKLVTIADKAFVCRHNGLHSTLSQINIKHYENLDDVETKKTIIKRKL